MVRPEMIQEETFGDFYLGCPSCKEAIYFPLFKNPNDCKPKKCSKCGEEFDWKGVKL